MKDRELTDQFLEQKLAEIREGLIFEKPENYFEELERKIFTERRAEFEPVQSTEKQKGRTVSIWRLASIAASLLLIIGLAWWAWNAGNKEVNAPNQLAYEMMLEDYLEGQLMDYDEEYLLKGLTDEEINNLSIGFNSGYEEYISTYIDDFEEFFYK